jgi:2'-5' RNA ligase
MSGPGSIWKRYACIVLLGGKPTHPDSLHLTLVFIGDVENAVLKDLAATGAGDCPPSRWRSTGRPAGATTISPISASPTAYRTVFELVDQLAFHLKVAGIAFDVRPYKPHITLVRKADCARFPSRGDEHSRECKRKRCNPNENPALEPIRWSARDFVLVRSSLRSGGSAL